METSETNETLFFISSVIRVLACGFLGEISPISKKCYFPIHFPKVTRFWPEGLIVRFNCTGARSLSGKKLQSFQNRETLRYPWLMSQQETTPSRPATPYSRESAVVDWDPHQKGRLRLTALLQRPHPQIAELDS